MSALTERVTVRRADSWSSTTRSRMVSSSERAGLWDRRTGFLAAALQTILVCNTGPAMARVIGVVSGLGDCVKSTFHAVTSFGPQLSVVVLSPSVGRGALAEDETTPLREADDVCTADFAVSTVSSS